MQNLFLKKITNKVVLIAGYLFFLPLITYASSIYTGDTLFQKKQYTEAFESYSSTLNNNQKYSDQMLLKMAFISEGLEKPAEALYYLSLAQQLAPTEETLYQIEQVANEHGLEGYEAVDSDLLYILKSNYVKPLIYVLTCLLILTVLTSIIQFITTKETSNLLRGAFIVCAISLVTINNWNWKSNLGVVNNKQAMLFKGASPASKIELHIPYGSRLEIIDKTDVWYKVKYNEEEGFIKETKLLTLL